MKHVLNRVELARTPMEQRYFRDVADDGGLDWERCERIIAAYDIQAYMRSPWR